MFRFNFILVLSLFLSTVSYAEEGMVIKLPEPKEKGKVSLEETIKRRRSERTLSEKALTIDQISQLLWACQGITDGSRGFRSAPSAGATFPLEVYILSPDGLFHYLPQTHSLRRLKDKDLREELSRACYGQGFVKDAGIDIVITADFKRTTSSYGKRGENYVYIEIGHAAENVHLQAISEGLGSVPVGAFSDDRVKKLLNLPEDLVPIYIIPVGYVE
ncbi:MAG: SagB/ThcOx family dehydrogenase [Candidatus Omnitrophica bacterium]|nr:SagB/ThcOx family dehydrogenase [Candidatus Omnitrophota bacterium]MBU1852456.1 SagB/ThcOx family dehydrogenase [Candidatus Omnitrophota bacterium]